MEDIVRKLNKNKPFLVHNAYNKLLSLMLDKKKCGTKFTRQAEEVVLLKDQCLSPNLATSQGACNTLVACVKHDLLTAQDVQTVLISMSAHNKNLFQILSAILSLHKPLGNVSEQCVDGNKSASPLVMVMKQCVGAWKPLLDIIDVSSSYLMPLLPWLSTLPAVPGNSATNPPDQRNDHKSDKNSKDFCRSDIPSSQIDSSVGDSGIRNSVPTSDELKSDLHEFIQMIVNSLKPPAPTPVIDSKEPQRTPWVIERSDTEESEGDEFSDLVYCFSDDWADFGMEEEQEDEEEEDYRYENRDVYVRSPVRTEENDFDTDDSADRDKDVEMKEVKSPSKTASDGASSHKDTPMTTDTPVVQEKPSTATLKPAEESGIASSSIKIEEKSPEENGNKDLMEAESDLIEKQLKRAVSKNDTKDQKETLSPQKNLIAGIPGPSLDPYRSPNTYMSEHRQIRTEETRHYLDMHNRPEPLHPNASNLNQNVTNTQGHSNIPQQTSKGVAQGQVRLNIPGNPQPLPGHGQNLMLNPQISTHVGNLRNQNASNIPLGNQPHPYFPTNVQLANNPNQNVPVRNPWNPLQNVPILNRPQPTYNYPVPNHINPYLRHPEFNKNEAIADKQVLDEIDETTAFWGRGEVIINDGTISY